jgi:3-oxoacyl-[acyl-carrier-protein] synthase II
MGKRRVVLTGLGAVTPVGNTVDETWRAILTGKGGVDRITLFDTENFTTKIAAEVKNFDPL